MEPRGTGAFAGEFVGTFMLVFFITAMLSVASGLGYGDFAVIGLVHAFVLALLIYSLGGTSGAHFNPAVTVTLTALRRIRPPDAAVYIVMQLLGGLAGAFVCKLLLDDEGKAINYGATVVSERFLQGDILPGLVVEAIGSFALMWAIMAMAVNPRGDSNMAGLIVGATLGFGVMVLAPLTGAGFNPARSFGPALVSGEWGGFADFVVPYVIGPVLGMILAAIAYSAIVLAPRDLPAQRPVDDLSG